MLVKLNLDPTLQLMTICKILLTFEGLIVIIPLYVNQVLFAAPELIVSM